MGREMKTKKVSFRAPEHLADAIKTHTKSEGRTMESWLADAARDALPPAVRRKLARIAKGEKNGR